jgi:hypothetical protein
MRRQQRITLILTQILIIDKQGQRIKNGLSGGGQLRFLSALDQLGHVAGRVVVLPGRTVVVVVVQEVRTVHFRSLGQVRRRNVGLLTGFGFATISHFLI